MELKEGIKVKEQEAEALIAEMEVLCNPPSTRSLSFWCFKEVIKSKSPNAHTYHQDFVFFSRLSVKPMKTCKHRTNICCSRWLSGMIIISRLVLLLLEQFVFG